MWKYWRLLINNAIAKSHTHLQFVKDNTRAKIAKEYALPTLPEEKVRPHNIIGFKAQLSQKKQASHQWRR